MQSINVFAITPLFMTALFGTAVACLALAVSAVLAGTRPGAGYVITGSVLYLAGTIGVTMVCNVPRNNRLASLNPTDPSAASKWAAYVTGWTAWNHVRTAAALIASALLTIRYSLQP
jgi:uncharacterized membrane protein